MATIQGKGKPQGYQQLPEGNATLHITNVRGIPRVNPTVVEMKMVDEQGRGWDKYPQKYDLGTDGGYAAFYYLLLNGFGVDLAETDEFNLDELEDTFVEFEIVHKENPNNPDRPYVNVKSTIGKGEAFGKTDAAEDDWDE